MLADYVPCDTQNGNHWHITYDGERTLCKRKSFGMYEDMPIDQSFIALFWVCDICVARYQKAVAETTDAKERPRLWETI